MELAILLSVFVILLLFRVPLAFALAGSSLLYMALFSPDFLVIIPQRIWAGTNSFVIIAT